MKPYQINIIRDAAIFLEDKDLKMAHNLMNIAHEFRSDGPLIKKKLKKYQQQLQEQQILQEQKVLKNLIDNGTIAIIPIGFRCYTKMNIFKSLGLKQASLPFDAGFFSPYSIVKVLQAKKIELNYFGKEDSTHSVCIKLENYKDILLGRGIKFKKSTYEEINKLTKNKSQKDINSYLDSTFGFYTLDNKNKFVLAHYNWHFFSDDSKSEGIHDPSINIPKINTILNNRLERMFELSGKAKHVIFVYLNSQGYKYMAIDDDIHDLNDLSYLSQTAKDIIGDKCVVTHFSEVNTVSKLLEKIGLSVS